MLDTNTQWQYIIDLKLKLRDAYLSYWLEHDLFSFGWWLILAITIAFWAIWFKLVDKSRLVSLTLYGALASVMSITLDAFGSNFVLWSYPTKLEPTVPPFFPIDFVALPVTYMLLYQYIRTWKPFLIAHMINSLVFAFILEPLLEWLNIYEPYLWRHSYSFVIYFIMAILLKYLTDQLQRIQTKAQKRDLK